MSLFQKYMAVSGGIAMSLFYSYNFISLLKKAHSIQRDFATIKTNTQITIIA